jgi:uncharacterized membrane protein
MNRPTDQDLDKTVAGMLRVGVTAAALVVLAGGALLLRHPWRRAADYSHFQPAGASLRTLPGIVASALHLDPRGIVQLGLLLLIATPVARVVFCVIGFARQRDRLYVAVSALVLAILVYSLSKGGR